MLATTRKEHIRIVHQKKSGLVKNMLQFVSFNDSKDNHDYNSRPA